MCDTLSRARYASYKRAHSELQHQEFFVQHKEDEWMRQQFDPRRLEETLKQRAEAALQAAAEFDAAAALEPDAAAADVTAEPAVRAVRLRARLSACPLVCVRVCAAQHADASAMPPCPTER